MCKDNDQPKRADSDSDPSRSLNAVVRPRFVAVMGGGDWMDASVDHVAIPEQMDLEKEQKRWREWYHGTYRPLRHTENRVDYISFVDWLKREGARDATEIEEYWEA